jgi:hypothetical protein
MTPGGGSGPSTLIVLSHSVQIVKACTAADLLEDGRVTAITLAASRTKLVINTLILFGFHLTIMFNNVTQQRAPVRVAENTFARSPAVDVYSVPRAAG